MNAPVAPPPITTTGPEVARAEDAERLKKLRRQGYEWTMNPSTGRKKTLLASAPQQQGTAEPKRRLLG